MPTTLTPDEVQHFEQEYQAGTMDATRRAVWEKHRKNYVSAPPAAAEPVPTPQPLQIDIAKPQGTPAVPRTWAQSGGRLALELGIPLALAVLTRGRDPTAMRALWQEAARLGLTSALGMFLGSEGAELFDPSVHPHQEAGRKALEAGGAALGGGLVPYAGVEAGKLARLGYGALRMGGTGIGAGAGSLAAEAFDPSKAPLQRAEQTGGAVAALQGAGDLAGNLLRGATGRSLTPLGRQAAETMQAADVAIPSSVSESRVWQAAEHEGERSLWGGRALASSWRQARSRLTDATESILNQLRAGRTPAQMERTTSAMYRGLDALAEQAMTRPGRPVPMTGVADQAKELVPLLGRGGLSPVFNRLQSFASTLSQAPDTLPYAQARRYARYGLDALTDAQRAGVPKPTLDKLSDLVATLQRVPTAEAIVDMRSLKPVFDDLRTLAARYLPDSAEGNLLRRVAQTENFLTPDAARELRSDLLEIGRTISSEGLRLGRYRGSLRHVAQELEGAVDQSIERAYTGLGHDVTQAWRNANAARKTQAQVARLSELVRSSTDATTHVVNGKPLLEKLADPEEVRALGDLSPKHVEQLRRLAQALAFHQETSGTGLRAYATGALPRTGEGHLRGLGPFQFAAGGLFATGHPILGFMSVLTPEMMGYLLSKPSITTYLTLGLRMNPASRQYAALAQQLVGVLAAEGWGQDAQSILPAARVPPTRGTSQGQP